MNNFYIIATPIGNIQEISNRAKEKLNEINIFFCEDTRVTKKLFNLLEISIKNKKFISCNQFLESEVSKVILNYLEKEDCALLSDAGYPTISDPGSLIKEELFKNEINPIIINGPCSIIHALTLCNFPTNNFYFAGFLNKKNNKRLEELYSLKNIYSTIIIFESVHNLIHTLNDIREVYGDIKINILKELTKINEKKYFGKISEIINDIKLKGEFIIIFENKKILELNYDQLFFEILKLEKKGIKTKEATRIVSYKYNLKNNDLFDRYKENKK